jgi:transcriptional regulator with XRE-family HTH domain
MITLISPSIAQKKIAQNLKERRLQMNLTQEGLSARSGVPLATLRKFEQKGGISLESLLKIMMVLGMLDAMVTATMVPQDSFFSIDEVIELETAPKRKRGSKT